MANEPPVIEVDRVSFSYNGKPVISEATFSVGPREFVSMVGPNGGGKTTLLLLLLGLLHPDRGEIKIFGDTPQAARRRIGYVPQNLQFDSFFPISVMDVVIMGRLGTGRLLGFGNRDRQVAREALAEVGAADLEDQAFGSLSGGQRQRVLIARALVGRPELLLLDEPTAGLDQNVEGVFYELLGRLNRQQTIVLVSHDLGFVSRHVRRVICVKGAVHVHPTSEINDELIRKIYGSGVRIIRHDEVDPPGGACG